MPPCWPVRHSSTKQSEYILSSMWRCVYTSVKISWEYPFCSALLFLNATINILSAFCHLAPFSFHLKCVKLGTWMLWFENKGIHECGLHVSPTMRSWHNPLSLPLFFYLHQFQFLKFPVICYLLIIQNKRNLKPVFFFKVQKIVQ